MSARPAFPSSAGEIAPWFEDRDGRLVQGAASFPAGWGGCYRVSESGGYVTEDAFCEVLPTEDERNLYLVCCNSSDLFGAGDLPLGEIGSHLSDPGWLAEAAETGVDDGPVFYTEAFPDDYSAAELAELAREKPGLFTEEWFGAEELARYLGAADAGQRRAWPPGPEQAASAAKASAESTASSAPRPAAGEARRIGR